MYGNNEPNWIKDITFAKIFKQVEDENMLKNQNKKNLSEQMITLNTKI